MKCPQCGHWNRASFPRCFRCGAPLPQDSGEQETQEWHEEIEENFKPKTYIDIDEEGNSKETPDPKDQLASEMKDLRMRKERGEEEQRRLRRQDTQPVISVSTGRRVQSTTKRRVVFTDAKDTPAPSYADERIRADAIPVVSTRQVDYDDYADTAQHPYDSSDIQNARPTRSPRAGDMTMRQMRATRTFGLYRFMKLLIVLLFTAGVFIGGYYLIYKPIFITGKQESLQARTIITSSIYNDLPAHIIKIPAEEGSNIYIKELHSASTAIGGYATFEVPDYEWYKDVDDDKIDQEIFQVTMTPYLKTSSGEQKPMDTLHFDVDIPLSPLTLISPDVTYLEVNSRPKYQVQFQVEKGSSVWINGDNYSDLVSTQDGLISYNATVQAIGENIITIECKTKYYRKNTVKLTLYREPQDILLELDSTLSDKYNGSTAKMTVTGTTFNKATITVLSEHENLDTSKLLTNGTFSFVAVFTKIGTNTITIQASYPGKTTTTVNFDVYHVPSATNYTKKAWPMDVYNYTEFLDNLTARVRNTQIYVCKGTIVQIVSTSPQRALMETGTETSSRQVLLENKSNDSWKVGDNLRVYGDAFGAYDGKPWLIGRYTYSNTP